MGSANAGLQAVLALNVVTVIWGSQHAVIKDLVEACPPAAINAVRFSTAAVLLPRGYGVTVGPERIAPTRARPMGLSGHGQPGRLAGRAGAWRLDVCRLRSAGMGSAVHDSALRLLLYLNVSWCSARARALRPAE